MEMKAEGREHFSTVEGMLCLHVFPYPVVWCADLLSVPQTVSI